MHFDLLIAGGEVIDPASSWAGRGDVAISHGRIAAVDSSIPVDSAAEVIDARGHYVLPGLIDLHTHVYWGVTYWGVRPDALASATGVTTWVDAGSAGALTVTGLHEFIAKPSDVQIYALMNISVLGLVAHANELANLDHCDVDLFCEMARSHGEFVRGVKVRMERRTVGQNGIAPLLRAKEAAERCGLPIMVHIAQGPPELEEVVKNMRPGDILTHCFTGQPMRIIDERGQLLEFVRRAWDNGIVLDIGHGRGSFSFETAEALTSAGYWPDVISSDTHLFSLGNPMVDLPTCLNKFLYLGMSLQDAVSAATARPAKALGLPDGAGTLKTGARADVAIFKLERGAFPLYDNFGASRTGTQTLSLTTTIAAGRVLAKRAPEPIPPWVSKRAAGFTPPRAPGVAS